MIISRHLARLISIISPLSRLETVVLKSYAYYDHGMPKELLNNSPPNLPSIQSCIPLPLALDRYEFVIVEI